MLYNLFENRDFVSVFAVALLAEGVDRNKMVAHISNEGKITWYVGEDYPPADALASIRACAEQERVKYETWLNGLSPAARREYQLERLPLPEFLEELRKAKEEKGGA